MPIAYEGSKPYIFVSYSHRDTKLVMRIMDYLQKAGYRVWFDGGIEAGSEWPEYIASHLSKCECFLSFISETFVESQNCRRELNFALDLKKPVLNVYIEEVELTAGMRMQLGLSQAMFRNNFKTEADFLEVLSGATILTHCREVSAAAPAAQKKLQMKRKLEKSAASGFPALRNGIELLRELLVLLCSPLKKVGLILRFLLTHCCILLEIAHCFLSLFGVLFYKWDVDNVFCLFLVVVGPAVAVALLNGFLIGKVGKMSVVNQPGLAFGCLLLSILSAILSVMACMEFLPQLFQLSAFLNVLIALVLNLVAEGIVVVIYFMIIGAVVGKIPKEKHE